MSTYERIKAANERLKGHARVTPLLESPFLNEIAGRRVLVKAECLQHTGSFKFRGAWSAISALSEADKKRGVIAYSSGNHAQGIAMASKALGVKATILMPADSPAIKIENTRALGGTVILFDRGNEDRDEIAKRENPDGALVLIKPFDNDYVIAGQGTTGLEIAWQAREQGIQTADVLVCCGGGGLTSGISLALEQDAPNLTVRPVEPEDFDDVLRSLQSGKIEKNDRTSGSLCDAIITVSPGEITFPIMKRLCGTGIAVSQDESLRAMILAWERLRIVIEPGGAVALAAALFHPDQTTGDHVICVASGGNVDRSVFNDALMRFGGTA
jgi:threonine dehydratase